MEIKGSIAKHFKEIFFGGNWTSVNLEETIKSINLTQAKSKIGTLNTIAVLTYHINYYVEGILPVFRGGKLEIKDKFSFDAPNFTSEKEWETFKKVVLKNAKLLISEIENLSDEQLTQYFVDEKYGTYYRNLHGIIEHTHYHLGQIKIIKKLLSENRVSVIKKIKDAFENVSLKDGVSLRETKIIDKYGTVEERKKAREKDEKNDWTKLIDNEILKELYAIGGLPFFDAKGLRFHLPAYMCAVIEKPTIDVGETLLFTLTNLSESNVKRFEILNVEQKLAVCAFLKYLMTTYPDVFEFEKGNIKKVIKEYWSVS